MVCQICGNSNDGSRFCTQCGAEFSNPLRSAPLNDPIKPPPAPPSSSPVSADSSESSLIGQTLDKKYILESILNLDGLGSVYCARRVLSGDNVAIKVLDPERVKNPEAIERFRREAQTATKVRHPNVLTVFDFGVSREGLAYVVVELTEGTTLRQLIRRNGTLTEDDAAEIIRQVGAALDEAHKQGVVHRDIKPENILVQKSPGGLNVKVLDFGIAALRDINRIKLATTGAVTGTPQYMSPEHCLGETLDGRSAVYSLGIVLYEMLTGVVPFNSTTPTAVVVQQVNEPPPSLRNINPRIPPAVESVVLHALKKERDERPQTAGEMASELIDAIKDRHGASAEAPRGSAQLDEIPTEAGSSRKGLVLGACALLLLAVGGAFSYGWYKRNVASENAALTVDSVAKNSEPSPVATATASPVPQTEATPLASPTADEAATTTNNPWSLIEDQTFDVAEPTNALGAVNHQMAIIKPGGQLALEYRAGQFFGDGSGNDLWIYAPDQEQVNYGIFVKDDGASQWQRIDINRRGFPQSAVGHDLGHHGLRRGRQVLIRNAGSNDLSIDAITAVYKDMARSAPVASKPRRTKPPVKRQARQQKPQVTKEQLEETKKSEKKKQKKDKSRSKESQ